MARMVLSFRFRDLQWSMMSAIRSVRWRTPDAARERKYLVIYVHLRSRAPLFILIAYLRNSASIRIVRASQSLRAAMIFRQSARVPHEPNAARDILAALALKATLLIALYAFFFNPAHRPTSDAAQTANAVVGTQSAKDIP